MRRSIALITALGAALLLALPAQAWTVVLYARADGAQAERVRRLVALADQVVIDRELRAGAPWRQAMAQAIVGARLVLVVWSRRSAASPEVGAEWRMAAAAGVPVVAVLLDATPLPPELAARQAVDWR